jgi:hypothetical protein
MTQPRPTRLFSPFRRARQSRVTIHPLPRHDLPGPAQLGPSHRLGRSRDAGIGRGPASPATRGRGEVSLGSPYRAAADPVAGTTGAAAGPSPNRLGRRDCPTAARERDSALSLSAARIGSASPGTGLQTSRCPGSMILAPPARVGYIGGTTRPARLASPQPRRFEVLDVDLDGAVAVAGSASRDVDRSRRPSEPTAGERDSTVRGVARPSHSRNATGPASLAIDPTRQAAAGSASTTASRCRSDAPGTDGAVSPGRRQDRRCVHPPSRSRRSAARGQRPQSARVRRSRGMCGSVRHASASPAARVEGAHHEPADPAALPIGSTSQPSQG